jgi:hypothetical protein
MCGLFLFWDTFTVFDAATVKRILLGMFTDSDNFAID